ncbi:Hint domain-containing protein [Mesobacterium sp. TK19101]|uniref:Hint domain-containing protein n=1 Tax=Mesobacterium hydrothermale TaxID=3111907 RepID=A0ABU6HBY0_9RHOB|nr:Hint domain-containing protein [Mesobacterium sp. TK19101]MEC3859766.1 Hint domain-containing protein [Mesobacterium sp. TK19101]
MGWLSFDGDGQSWIAPQLAARRLKGVEQAIPRGTLIVETPAPTLATGPTLLRMTRTEGAQGLFSLQWVPAMGIVLVITVGRDVFHASLPLTGDPARLRISFSWDSPANVSRLAVENPDDDSLHYAMGRAPAALMLSDMWALARERHLNGLAAQAGFMAVSDGVEPIGPAPSLHDDTAIDTPHGPVPLKQLKPGDTVRTLSGAVMPVLQVVRRSVPAVGSFRPVRLRAPHFGLKRDLVATPQQRLVVTGGDVEYDYGADAVRLAISNLPRGFAQTDDAPHRAPFVNLAQLVLPEPVAVLCHGVPLDTLNIGRIRRQKDRLEQSLLAQGPLHLLPEHGPSPYPLLGATETASLAATRAA